MLLSIRRARRPSVWRLFLIVIAACLLVHYHRHPKQQRPPSLTPSAKDKGNPNDIQDQHSQNPNTVSLLNQAPSSPPSNTSLSRRAGPADSPWSWDSCVARGCKLMQYLNAAQGEIGIDPSKYETRWTEYDQLEDYGWEESIVDEDNESQETMEGYLPLIAGATEPGVIIPARQWLHAHASSDADGSYPATQGKYLNLYNTDAGLIVAADVTSPATMAYRSQARMRRLQHLAALAANAPPNFPNPAGNANLVPGYDPSTDPQAWPAGAKVVPLSQWSDVTWLQWADETADDITQQRNLKYILHFGIVNDNTEAAIIRAVGGRQNLGTWADRRTFLPHQEAFSALLGTPNGNGVAWFLAQHRAALGQRTVESITVWCPTPGAFILYSKMLLTISPYTGPAAWNPLSPS